MATVAATGGTFDILHRGHKTLLEAAFGYDHVIIGLSTDRFAGSRGKPPRYPYDTRLYNLQAYLDGQFAGRSYTICPLDDYFGPAVLCDTLDALVVSEETKQRGYTLNDMRHTRGLDAVEIVVVPMVQGADGTRISGTKIRDGIMDAHGSTKQVE